MISSPTRVIVDADGLGVPSSRALSDYGITPDIIFLRNDNWSLGAPDRYEYVAYSMWQREWTHFARKEDIDWRPIAEYS
jgi:hypothetical protein